MPGATILCTSCASISEQPLVQCAKCGGRNVRICGKCETKNSVAKNYCDKCGEAIGLPQSVEGQKLFLSSSPSNDIPATAIRYLTPPDKNESQQPFTHTPSPVGEEDSTKEPLQLRKFINNAAALIGICVAAVAVFRFYESRKPEVVVPALAREYLESLRKGHYAQAYALFSPEAKKNCTESQLRSAFESTPWTWSNLNIVRREPDAFIFSYDKSLSGTRAQKEYLLLTQIGDQWEIPYNSSLIQAIEKSFNKADVDTGLAYAQIAKNVNPRDPIAWGYLCEAAYAKKLNSKIESYCLKALELANIYPSNLSPKSLLHLHAVMADTYHRKLNQPENAVQQYAALLAYPHLSREDQCQILLIRSQIYSDMSRPGEALNDLQRGATLCSAKKDVIFIQQMRENLHAPMPQ